MSINTDDNLEITITLPTPYLYLCNRTSEGISSDITAPCEEAFKIYIKYTDVRSVNSVKKLFFYSVTEWYITGTNHRVENGKIMRDLYNNQSWAVQLCTLEELSRFIKKYGNVILGIDAAGYNTIEIYDDYRE